MLKLPAFCPADQTDAVLAALRAEPRVHNVLRLPTVDVEAGRDVVMAHLHAGVAAMVAFVTGQGG